MPLRPDQITPKRFVATFCRISLASRHEPPLEPILDKARIFTERYYYSTSSRLDGNGLQQGKGWRAPPSGAYRQDRVTMSIR